MLNAEFKSLFANVLREEESSYMVNEIITRFSTLQELFSATETELMNIRGIGKIKSRQILSALKLAKLLNTPTNDPYVISSPKDVHLLLRNEIGYAQVENFVCIYLNVKNHVLGYEILAVGSISSCTISIAEVFKGAIKRSCPSILVAHNHPSQVTSESDQDVELSRRLVAVGELLQISVLDHVIVTYHGFNSLREKGLM